MYSIIEYVLKNSNYDLITMINKINKLWIEDYLTENEHDELISLARNNALPDNSYLKNTEQIANLWEYCLQLDLRLKTIENNSCPEPPVKDEYPTYIQPTGEHDAYKIGDKITFQNKKYICEIDNCVWDPLTYPIGWKLVEEP